MEASVRSSGVHCSDKTIEAAEALLHMDSPISLREDRSPGKTRLHTLHDILLHYWHLAFGNGALGNGALGDGALGNGALGDGAFGDCALGNGALGDGALGDGAFGNGACTW